MQTQIRHLICVYSNRPICATFTLTDLSSQVPDRYGNTVHTEVKKLPRF
jgi:hypothetical protein